MRDTNADLASAQAQARNGNWKPLERMMADAEGLPPEEWFQQLVQGVVQPGIPGLDKQR